MHRKQDAGERKAQCMTGKPLAGRHIQFHPAVNFLSYCKSIKIYTWFSSDAIFYMEDHFLVVRILACWFHTSLWKNTMMRLWDRAAPLVLSLFFLLFPLENERKLMISSGVNVQPGWFLAASQCSGRNEICAWVSISMYITEEIINLHKQVKEHKHPSHHKIKKTKQNLYLFISMSPLHSSFIHSFKWLSPPIILFETLSINGCCCIARRQSCALWDCA